MEFALILPVILLSMVGMLEFARAWNLHQVMTDAAREGARRAVIPDATAPTHRPRTRSKAAMWGNSPRLGYDPQYASMGVVLNITRRAEPDVEEQRRFRHHQPLVPYRFAILPGRPITMRSSFTMRNE